MRACTLGRLVSSASKQMVSEPLWWSHHQWYRKNSHSHSMVFSSHSEPVWVQFTKASHLTLICTVCIAISTCWLVSPIHILIIYEADSHSGVSHKVASSAALMIPDLYESFSSCNASNVSGDNWFQCSVPVKPPEENTCSEATEEPWMVK